VQKDKFIFFYVNLTVHHSIDLFLSPTGCTFALFFNICIALAASTCFEQYYVHLQEVKIVFYSIWYVILCERPCSALQTLICLIGTRVYILVPEIEVFKMNFSLKVLKSVNLQAVILFNWKYSSES
jgi:hypothetical protein